jgi:hypothetical protein
VLRPALFLASAGRGQKLEDPSLLSRSVRQSY